MKALHFAGAAALAATLALAVPALASGLGSGDATRAGLAGTDRMSREAQDLSGRDVASDAMTSPDTAGRQFASSERKDGKGGGDGDGDGEDMDGDE